MPPDPAVSETRTAVRRTLASPDAAPFKGSPLVVACSGGADSLALAAATAHVARQAGVEAQAIVVDHGLQVGSDAIAARSVEQLAAIGMSAQVVEVDVDGMGGLEAAARKARYVALRAERPSGSLVLLGHTLDDQAETVLLGLGRGSGARSIAGMRSLDPPWARPFLGVRRTTTEAACRAQGLEPWHDPHNTDARFARVRLRTEVLPLLEEVLQGGVAEALARTARQLREDCDALEEVAETELSRVRADHGLDCAELRPLPAAVRRRVLRDWLAEEGVPEMTDAHLRAADGLVADWRGQGGPALPGDFVLRRAHGRLRVETAGRKPPNG
ncbi:tRNA lysidine(34) synthetase TilS [Saccharopolyspora rhizosphaerae]|uniref:tRNA(Ile)-lysidine synthase n=1 Tax=Saccharopolyspora rhizosphaerae TaxID=2492662 RepID=A0A426JVN4_9PSEU|nr:tRNA lysidine(34) synthetase TilS [Saccharopolyspora rhizosphaerae]RRO17249.1 tRNA lysidine(34) synthetase TilS [Saccharopolyspora rhizosphaerae]